jgi:hypothetical protein
MVLEGTVFNNVDWNHVPSAAACDQHNEAAGSIKRRKFRAYVRDRWHLKKGLTQGQSYK